MNTLIRKMSSQDVPHIHSLQKDYIELNWSEVSFYKEVKSSKSICLVAETDDKLIGYIITKFVIDEAQILNFFVHRDYRRLGIGSLLLEDMIRRLKFKGVETLFLETRRSNQGAISLYETFDFLQIARRRDYYTDPVEDGIMMIRMLH